MLRSYRIECLFGIGHWVTTKKDDEDVPIATIQEYNEFTSAYVDHDEKGQNSSNQDYEDLPDAQAQ